MEDERMRALLAEYIATAQQPARPALDRIAVRADGVLRIVRTSDVDWIESEGNYVRVHAGNTSHLVRMTAANLESQLDPRSFIIASFALAGFAAAVAVAALAVVAPRVARTCASRIFSGLVSIS